ncbi:hypothetical protein [Vallitalea guaymasensis]|uniref:hypothetical protein n=1 Tax=Vallitalea guaymasensis TaxID=1185412 RepID=UPI000DE520C9|nr:hypothetical protein [Vallitalea guaymasensis]
MKKGHLIAYDEHGQVYYIKPEFNGNITNALYPTQLTLKQLDYGYLDNKVLISVDILSGKLITKDIETKPSYEDLENKVLLLENEKVEGGIF